MRFLRRFLGALALLPFVYEEVEADHRAMPQALAIVALSSIATGFAYFEESGWRGVLGGLMGALLGWLVWAWLTYYIGTHLLPEPQTRADWGQLLRTTGFAAAPGIFRVFGAVPEIRDAILALTALWMLIGFVLAVRQALDYRKTWRAVVVCLGGGIVYVGLLFLIPRACRLQAPI